MKKIISSVLASLLLLCVGPANANGYFGIGGGLVTLDDSVDKVKPINVTLRLGYEVNQYFELGGEFSGSLISDEIGAVDFDVNNTFLFVKANAPLDNGSKLYLLYGPTNVELVASIDDVSASVDDSDTGIGFGIQVPAANGRAQYTFDYIRYFDDNDVDVTGLNFNYLIHF